MDAKTFAHAVEEGVKRSHAQHAGQAHAGTANPLTEFCSIWPTVKPILGVVSGFLTYIPQYGPMAQGALSGLMSVGDQVAGEICNTPATPIGSPSPSGRPGA